MRADPRSRLVDELAATQRRLARLTADFDEVVAASKDTNADDEHDPEGATIAFERAQVSSVVQATGEHLAEVRAAIARWDAGDYGTCERCGAQIPAERLEARPTARRCVACVAR